MKRCNSAAKAGTYRWLTFCFFSFLSLSAWALTGKTINPEKQHSAATDVKDDISNNNISIDNTRQVMPSGLIVTGSGEGDLVLVLYDGNNHSRRKKSFMLDLSFKDDKGNLNDMTCNDILNMEKNIVINHKEMSDFIESSKHKDQISWQVFGIANHYTTQPIKSLQEGEQGFPEVNFINYGLVVTEREKTSAPLTARELLKSRGLRANLIKENNLYDIGSNGSLVSYSGEPSAYDHRLYGTLANGSKVMGLINERLHLSIHKQIVTNTKKQGKRKSEILTLALGTADIRFDQQHSEWILIFSPEGK